jgi:type IV pilus assembly protein PilV
MNVPSRFHRMKGPSPVCTRGFSLIETLIALVVMSVGLLGVAALHVDSMQRGQAGLFMTRAILLASDMADRIRANPLGSLDYAIEWDEMPEPGALCADTVDGPAPGWPAGCTPDVMARYDVEEWKRQLAPTSPLGLPDGDGRIVANTATSPPTFVIEVRWTTRNDEQTYTLSVQDDPLN